jgi:hypothetical protein
VSATNPAISPPNRVNTNHTAMLASAAVAARRVSTDSTVASASHRAM